MASLKPGVSDLHPCRLDEFHDRAVVASLKLRISSSPVNLPLKIPRPRGRGLIEALPLRQIPKQAKTIPRPRGRGLIEAKHCRANIRQGVVIPRPRGRGLIEAQVLMAKLTPFTAIPRPRGRGLIEASDSPAAGQFHGKFHDRAVVASLKPAMGRLALWLSRNSTTARSWPH